MDKNKKNTTMKEVADRAGVSQPTVSNYLNGKTNISDKNAYKISNAIKELNYVPNALARALKQKSTKTIGLMIPNIDDEFYSQITKGIEKNLREHGYLTYLCNTYYKPQLEKQLLNSLIQQNVAGIIVSCGLTDNNVYQDIIDAKIPLVVIDTKVEDIDANIPSVEIDNFRSTIVAIEHLYKVGARKICFASEPLYNRSLKQRFEGYKEFLKKSDLEFHDDLIFIESTEYNKIEMGYNLGAKILLDDSIDAIFATSDPLAIGIMQRLAEYNIKIPDDILIVGYDNVPISKLVTPSLTTISQPQKLMATMGSEILVNMLEGKEVDLEPQIIEPSLIIRESSIRVKK